MLQEPCDTKGGKREGGEQCGTEQETWSQVGDWARGGGLPPGGCVNSPPPAGGAPPATAVVASAAAAGVVQAPAAYTQVVVPYSQVGAAKAKAGREGGGEQCGTEQETEQECWPTQSQSICLYLSEFKTN